MNNIASKTASAMNLINAIGFQAFWNGIKNYGVGAQFSVSDVLGDYAQQIRSAGGNLVTLGKLIRNNVNNGNLSGIQPLNSTKGSAQKYIITGPIKLKNYFSVPYYENKLTDPKGTIKIAPNILFVFCNHESKRGSDDITFKILTAQLDYQNQIAKGPSYTFKKEIGNCGLVEINQNNSEFPAIQSVWHGFDKVSEMEQEGKLKGIAEVRIIGTNAQMMRRVAGCYFDTSLNAYAYTQYIQSHFMIFMKGEIKGIQTKVSLAACDKAEMKKIYDSLI